MGKSDLSTASRLSEAQQVAARDELTRFFQLVGDQNPEQFKMFSGAVDAIWHDLIQDPEVYRSFLNEGAIEPTMGHSPIAGFGVIEWVNQYHPRFGKLPQIWFTDEGGTLDEESYNAYLSTDVVVAAWDCGVIIPKM
jgi:hypothetical protein